MNRLVCACLLVLVTGCQPRVLDNADFNLWCGKSLCDWKTEQGSVRRVPTWDAQDYGVELVGNPVIISQIANQGALGAPCLKFSIVANVETRAEVQLELDFYDDDTVDYREGIPGVRWQRLDLLVKLPTQPFGSMKVSLDKQGSGTAVFAGLHADGATSCDGTPIQLSHLKSGEWCTEDADCESGHCSGGLTSQSTCGECGGDTECAAGLLCGAVEPKHSNAAFRRCIPPLATPDGDVCGSDQECAHGHCQGGVCGECVSDDQCEAGAVCGSGPAPDGGSPHRVCVVPGSLAEGRACSAGHECVTGNCCFGVCMPADKLLPWTCPSSLASPSSPSR